MNSHIACKYCGQVHGDFPLKPGTKIACVRCGSTMAKRTHASLHATGALTLAALILYVPANLFPVLHLDMYGAVTENTVWTGCVRLFEDGDWAVATIVFLASILIPLVKLFCLFFLVVATKLNLGKGRRSRVWLYRAIEAAGKWAMLDVFVVATLVSLVKLQGLATIIAGKGLIAFCSVVVLTILASASFDPHLIWQPEEAKS